MNLTSPFSITLFVITALALLGLPIGLAMMCGSILYLLLAGLDMGTVAEQFLNGMYSNYVILAVPLSGYFYSLASGIPVVWFGVIELPVLMERNAELKPVLKATHYWLNMTLAACVAVHVGAALKHHFIDRDGVFRRMLP